MSLLRSSHLSVWVLLWTGPEVFKTISAPPWRGVKQTWIVHYSVLPWWRTHACGLQVSHLGIYEVSADHRHQGLHVLRHVISGQRSTAARNFCSSHSHHFVTRGLSAGTKNGKGQKSWSSLLCYYSVITEGLCYRPGSSFADEDQGTHDDAGQGDAHTNNDPGHGLLVYVVETIGEHWRVGEE